MMMKNQSDGLTETDCSRQMGRYKRMIVSHMILCLHKGWRRMLKDGTRWLIICCGWLGLKHQPTNCFRYDWFRRHTSLRTQIIWQKMGKGLQRNEGQSKEDTSLRFSVQTPTMAMLVAYTQLSDSALLPFCEQHSKSSLHDEFDEHKKSNKPCN